MKLNVIGRTNTLFGNLYALSDDGTVYVGRPTAEQIWFSDCELRLTDLEWVRYPKSKTPKYVFESPIQRVIEVEMP
jgi:hypothetical protein